MWSCPYFTLLKRVINGMGAGSACFGKTPSEKSADGNHRHGHKEPQYREGQAYLPEKIEHQSGVIPDIPAKPQIDDAAGDEFQRGNDDRSEKAFHYQRFIGTGGEAAVQNHKAKSPGKGHAPVGEPPEYHLYK